MQYDATGYQPQPPELRYFLTQFIVKHFSRLRATVQREYPDSLLFLEPRLGGRHDRAERAEPGHRDVPDEPVRRRGRRRRPERQPERADEAAVQGVRELPEGAVHARARARSAAAQTYIAQVDFVLRDHVPNEFVRVNPLGLQITYFRVDQAFEEGQPMIANVAFLAALTTFLVVAWLAGELTFLAPFKAGMFRTHGVTIGVAIVGLFLNLCAAYYGSRAGCSSATPAGSSTHMDRQLGSRRRGAERPPARTSSPRGTHVMWRDIDPRNDERERPDLSRRAPGVR